MESCFKEGFESTFEKPKETVGKAFSVPAVASVVDHPLDCIEALPLVWDVEGLKDMWEGRIVTTDPHDGSLQVEEALLLQQRSESHLRPVVDLLTGFDISSPLEVRPARP